LDVSYNFCKLVIGGLLNGVRVLLDQRIVITLSGPLTSSKLKITNGSCRYTSLCYVTLCLWNKHSFLLLQPHLPDHSPPSSSCSVDVIVISSFFAFTYLIINYSFTLSHKTQNLLFHKSFRPYM